MSIQTVGRMAVFNATTQPQVFAPLVAAMPNLGYDAYRPSVQNLDPNLGLPPAVLAQMNALQQQLQQMHAQLDALVRQGAPSNNNQPQIYQVQPLGTQPGGYQGSLPALPQLAALPALPPAPPPLPLLPPAPTAPAMPQAYNGGPVYSPQTYTPQSYTPPAYTPTPYAPQTTAPVYVPQTDLYPPQSTASIYPPRPVTPLYPPQTQGNFPPNPQAQVYPPQSSVDQSQRPARRQRPASQGQTQAQVPQAQSQATISLPGLRAGMGLTLDPSTKVKGYAITGTGTVNRFDGQNLDMTVNGAAAMGLVQLQLHIKATMQADGTVQLSVGKIDGGSESSMFNQKMKVLSNSNGAIVLQAPDGVQASLTADGRGGFVIKHGSDVLSAHAG